MDSFVYHNRDGVRRTMHVQDENKFTIHTEQDLEEVLEGVKRDQELHPRRSTNKMVGRFPVSVYERSIREQWDDDDWKKYLNSFEAAPFRIWKGRV